MVVFAVSSRIAPSTVAMMQGSFLQSTVDVLPGALLHRTDWRVSTIIFCRQRNLACGSFHKIDRGIDTSLSSSHRILEFRFEV